METIWEVEKGLPKVSRVVTFVRMRTLCVIPLSLFVLSACTRAATGAPADPAATKAPVREQLASDTPRTTPDGATFVAPGGWWLETRTNAIILTPEGDSRIALVDVHVKDADL